MKIKEIRTRVIEWRGKTVPLPPHFCTNPMDAVSPMLTKSTMGTFTFHSWLICEIFTDNGLVGIGNAALSPRVTKQVIDLYLKPLLIGAGPVGHRISLAAHVSQDDGVWPQRHRHGRHQRGGHRAVGHSRQVREAAGLSSARRAHETENSRLCQPALFSTPLDELARESKRYKDEGYTAMKMRFGWGPTDGPEGMQKNLALVRTVRETVGDGVDIMADAYMGWNLDYAKRMIPQLEKYNLRWLEEPVIPDEIHGYAELKKCGRIPIAGGEHEFTLYGFRELIESHCVDYIQFDTNRVGGISQARKIAALAEAHSIPVIPHAGQMHNYHVVMASLNSPMAEYFPPVDVEVGNELFWYCFNGEPTPKDGYIDLDENTPGLGLTVNEEKLKNFEVIE